MRTRNTFPRLPVREGENVLVGVAAFEDAVTVTRFVDSGVWQPTISPTLAPWRAKPTQALMLAPTARSALQV